MRFNLFLSLLCLGAMTGCAHAGKRQNVDLSLEARAGSKNKPSSPSNPPIFINRGQERTLCQDIQKLLFLPENKDYLYSKEQLSEMRPDEVVNEWKSAKSLVVPVNSGFQDFAEPTWKDLNSAELDDPIFRKFVSFIQERPEVDGITIELGKNITIQKSKIDMNLDGELETVYRSIGIDLSPSVDESRLTNFISIHFNKHGGLSSGLHLKGQVLIYKDQSIFFIREMGLASLTVVSSLENEEIYRTVQKRRKFEPLGCTFSSFGKENIGE